MSCGFEKVTLFSVNTHRLVLPGDLNQFGFLFGGQLLAWVDEASWIAASLEFPGCKFVTIGMDEVAFKKPVRAGQILAIESVLVERGTSSVAYEVTVTADKALTIFNTRVTFVNVSEDGEKQSIQD